MEGDEEKTGEAERIAETAIHPVIKDANGKGKSFLLRFDDHAADHLVNFYEPEQADDGFFRWSEPVAMVRLDVPPSDYQITIETGALRCGGLDFPFRIYWNDQRIVKSQIKIDGGRIVFSIPRDSIIRNDEQRLTVSCKPLNAEQGRRQLGLPIKWIRLQQLGVVSPEFSNPTKSRSRFWRRTKLPNLRRMVGLKSPSPSMPIWELKLPNSSTSLRGCDDSTETAAGQGNDLVIVSSVEINSRHGTGLLIQYMFEDFSQITTVSSQRCFHGDRVRSAQHFEVPFEDLQRHQIYEMVLKWFKDNPPKRAYIVPYYKQELWVAVALADLFGTEICLHIMDDQCLYEDEIPAKLLDEAMAKAGLIFVISPEMRNAYQRCFEYPMYILPPVVPEKMIRTGEFAITKVNTEPKRKWLLPFNKPQRVAPLQTPRGIIIGNIWNEKWLSKLQDTLRNSGYQVDWYSNNPDQILLSTQRDQLADSGIHLKRPLWGSDLVNELRQRPFAIMPSGMLGDDEERESLARLSLPSRIPFVMAVSNIPIVVLGSPETAAAKFVERFQIGAVVDYQAQQFKSAVDYLLQADVLEEMQQRARSLSATFSARNLSGWINESIQMKQPVDNRFEAIFSDSPSRSVVDAKTSVSFMRRSNWNKEDLWQSLRRLKKQGLDFKQVVDVGAGDGTWSWSVSQVYPDSKFALIEPLLSRYREQDRNQLMKALNEPEIIELTLCDLQGETEFGDQESPIGERSCNKYHGLSSFARQNLDTVTLDDLAVQRQFDGPALLKIDASQAEHLVIGGGVNFIKKHVDTIFLTVDLNPRQTAAKTYADFLILMNSLDFQLIDESPAQRCPKSDILTSKNLVFSKKHLIQDKLVA